MTDKFKALVHYICDRMSAEPARLGKTKLNKILWYSDVWAFQRRGAPITDTKYIKQAWGPVAKSLPPVLDDLHREGIVVQRNIAYPGGSQTQFFSTEAPDLEPFSAEEIAIVDEMINIICYEHSARSISNLSHDLVWQMHEIGEEMPLFASHVMRLGEVTADDMKWALGSGGD